MSLLDGWQDAPSEGEGTRPGGVPDLLRPLGRGGLGDTWVAGGEGARLAAKRLRLPPNREPAEVRDALQPLTGLRDPALVPVLGVVAEGDQVWVCSELAPGVPLHRLLVVAALTPNQVAAVVEGVCRGLDVLHRAGLGHGALHARNVHVGPDGAIRLGDAGIAPLVADGERSQEEGGRDLADWPGRDRAAAAALFQRALEAGRRAGWVWRSPEARVLIEAAEALGQARNPSDVESALAALRRAATGCLEGTGATASAELAALVRRLESRPPAPPPGPARPPQPVPASAGPPSGGGTAADTAPTPQPRLSRGSRYVIAIGLAGLVLVVIVAVAIGWRHGSASRSFPRASPAPVAGAVAPPVPTPVPTPVPVPTPRPVPALAPGQAGPVTAVELQSPGDCRPGAPCAIRVTVQLRPASTSVPLAWSFEVFDRCTGALIELPGAQMSADPGWNYAYDTSYPMLPPGRGLAVVAVTSEPARAASAPLLVPAGEPSC